MEDEGKLLLRLLSYDWYRADYALVIPVVRFVDETRFRGEEIRTRENISFSSSCSMLTFILRMSFRSMFLYLYIISFFFHMKRNFLS